MAAEGTAETRRSLRLGDILVEQGVVTESQLRESLQYQKDTGARLGEALISLGYVTSDQLADALAWQGHYGLSVLAELLPSPNVAGLLTEKFCRARQVMPIDFNRSGAIVLAMVNPADVLTIDDVRLITGLEVAPVAATLGALGEAWDMVFSGRGHLETKTQAEEEKKGPTDRELAEYDTVVSLVEEILATGMRQKASDIHFEPQAERMIVRLRIDGVLHSLTEVRKEIKDGVVSRIKIMGDMDIAEKRLPQDGRATFSADGRHVDLRIASIPTVFGENVTIRLLDDLMFKVSLEQLGMGEDELAQFRKALKRPWGEILITGPTGSGKSTTLYAGLEELNRPGVKIYTVEDPVERRIPGIIQSQVRSNIGLTFASMLRSLVRSDPDIIMIGEIRDHETALIATEASLTGHLVLSTLHTNDAASAIARLTEMGLPAYLIASGLECVVAQRLARKLCSRCKETVTLTPENMSEEERDFLGVYQAVIAKAVGCNRCFNTGYSGRIGLFEVLPVGREIRRLILDHASADAIRDQAVEVGTKSLREDGRLKVLAGLTTIEEVQRVTA
ncbi:MAG: Flp pilus assembly complex ATPase component TadA [Actinobacteria bacterium]|nr:Flp pilus assembly complex ATPase component TadA [Actinomycetota bacterium]